jgi:hypothetical protein
MEQEMMMMIWAAMARALQEVERVKRDLMARLQVEGEVMEVC